MSDIGTYKSIYEQIKPFAEIIDKAIIALKTNQSDSIPLKQLEELFERMSTNQPKNASERVLKIVLRARGMQDMAYVSGINDTLQKNPRLAIDKIEKIAKLLEEEQNEAFAKMGSWAR